MKVGILTFHNAPNYGAAYQALGLQQALIELGHEPVFLNYTPEYMRGRVSLSRGWGFKSGKIDLPHILNKFKSEIRRQKFKIFKNSHLRVSRHLETKNELNDYAKGLDAIIVGSDQVWNLNWQQTFDDTYFLGWLSNENKHIKKIAYGACFGCTSQPDHHLKRAAELLLGFDVIGLRNDINREIVSEKAKKIATIVDPGFFVKNERTSEENVFMYFVKAELASSCLEASRQIQKIVGGDIVHAHSESKVSLSAPDVLSYSCMNPIEWFKQLTNSKFVVSESFHGVVFSIANNIPFLSITSDSRSERIQYLIERYELEGRLFHPDEMTNVNYDALIKKPNVSSLADDIAFSKKFLADTLAG
jgi:hypothetical protein